MMRTVVTVYLVDHDTQFFCSTMRVHLVIHDETLVAMICVDMLLCEYAVLV